MAEVKYLVTVDEETHRLIKVERMDEDGGLTEIPLDKLPKHKKSRGGANYTVNIFMGGDHLKVSESGAQVSDEDEPCTFGFVLPGSL
ncbi:MAG: hypothetical protein MI919_18620 [Holophagales bacterium]|nr:hypothetical protein [Holophagales bacterium]